MDQEKKVIARKRLWTDCGYDQDDKSIEEEAKQLKDAGIIISRLHEAILIEDSRWELYDKKFLHVKPGESVRFIGHSFLEFDKPIDSKPSYAPPFESYPFDESYIGDRCIADYSFSRGGLSSFIPRETYLNIFKTLRTVRDIKDIWEFASRMIKNANVPKQEMHSDGLYIAARKRIKRGMITPMRDLQVTYSYRRELEQKVAQLKSRTPQTPENDYLTERQREMDREMISEEIKSLDKTIEGYKTVQRHIKEQWESKDPQIHSVGRQLQEFNDLELVLVVDPRWQAYQKKYAGIKLGEPVCVIGVRKHNEIDSEEYLEDMILTGKNCIDIQHLTYRNDPNKDQVSPLCTQPEMSFHIPLSTYEVIFNTIRSAVDVVNLKYFCYRYLRELDKNEG